MDQTSVAKLPDFGDHSHDNEGESVHIEIPQICSTLKEKDAKSVKMLLRSLGLGVMREERKHFWKGIYHRREGDQVDANKAIYEDTVKTCFGKMGKNVLKVLLNRHPFHLLSIGNQRNIGVLLFDRRHIAFIFLCSRIS